MSKSNAHRTWLERIESGRMSKAQCQQFARVVNGLIDCGQARGHRTNLTQDEALELKNFLQSRGGVLLTDEHTAQGLAWLERYAAKRLPQLPADWRERFDHFRFMGDAVEIGHGGWPQYVPVWRIVLRGGQAWDYAATAWQAPHQMDHAWEVSA